MYVSGIFLQPELRGAKPGRTVIDAILRTIGRACPLVILQAVPVSKRKMPKAPLSALTRRAG